MPRFKDLAPIVRPLLLAAGVGVLALSGQLEALSNFSSALGDKDTMARWTSTLAGVSAQATPVTLIDIDDETLALFGPVDRAPRRLVADLIRLTTTKAPMGVFVDLDTSRPSPQAEADAPLVALVQDYPADAPPLAFARRFASGEAAGAATTETLKPLSSILDSALAARPHVFSLASIARADGDQILRRAQLFATLCNASEGATYASPHLFAAALRNHGAGGRDVLKSFLDTKTAQTCAKAQAAPPVWPRNGEIAAPIWFLPGLTGEGTSPWVSHGGRLQPAFRRLSARTLLTANGSPLPARAIADDPFAGRFVIIGSSHADSFDMHMTPLGLLPGALIVATSVATAPATLSGYPLPGWLKIAVSVAVFIVVVALTRKLRALVAGLVGGLALLTLLAVLGRVVAPSAAVEIVLSATAMAALFSVLESVFEIAKGWKNGLGWSSLLKPSARAAKPAPHPAPPQEP